MFFSIKTRKKQRNAHRGRPLRLESLERRELMDGYGLHSSLPSASTLETTGEPTASYATQSSNVLVSGSVRNESISRAREVDRFKIKAEAGQTFQVAMATQSGLNATMRVYAPGGRLLLEAPTGTARTTWFTAASAGEYIVQIQATNLTSTGNYRVGVESLSSASTDAKAFTVGNVINGQLSGTIQVDQYKVAARAGQTFQVAMATQSGLNATMRVYAPGGRLLLEAPTGTARTTWFTAASAGEYIVQIQATNLTSTGNYRVGVESLSSASTDAKAFTVGNVINGQFSGTIQVDQFKVAARAGQTFQVAMATQSGLNATMRVYAPGGRLLLEAPTGTARTTWFTAASAGEYIVQFQATNLTSTGNYRVGVESLSSASTDAKAFTVGNVINGQFSGTIQVDQYKVAARAGQTFQVAMATQSGLNATMRVYAPGGRLLLEAPTGTARTTWFTAASAGEYIVQIQATNLTSSGNYRVGVESLSSASTDARALLVGGVNNGQLTGSIQSDQHRFSVRSGQRFQLELSPQAALNARIRVFSPGGRLILEGSTSSPRTYYFTSDIAGEYIVMIEAANLTSLGSYRLGLRRS